MSVIYGYARVSTEHQNEHRQLILLRNKGVKESNIFIDKISGKDFDRPNYAKMLRTVAEGDLIVLSSIDRLGRNYKEIQEQWRLITKEKQVEICVIDMPLLDTRTGKDLIGTFIADLTLQILSFVAESERNSIKQRQADGIKAAKERGVHLGRPYASLPENYNEILDAWMNYSITTSEAADLCGISKSTFYRRAGRRK